MPKSLLTLCQWVDRYLEHTVHTGDKNSSHTVLNDCQSSKRERKKRIRFKGRGVCEEGTRDEEEEGEASSPLWMTFWQQGLMVSTRKIEIFQVIQGWPHFSLLFPLTLSLSIIKRLSVGIKQSPWGSSCVRLGTVLSVQSAFSKTRATRVPSPAKERCIFKRPVTCC